MSINFGRRGLWLLGCIVVALASGTARASDGSANYVVAEAPVTLGGGTTATFTQLDVQLCINNNLTTACPDHPLDTVTFSGVSPATVGTTIWTDARSSNFQQLVSGLTNGTLDQVQIISVFVPSGGGAGIDELEPQFFGDQVGPSGVDLSGYTIDRIGFRIDTLSFFQVGSFFDIAGSGTFIFEGRIASPQACMDGGWRSLRGPSGTAMSNQGQCIQLVNTGK